MAQEQSRTPAQRAISETLEGSLEEMRAADLDDGKTYFLSVMNVMAKCLSLIDQKQSEMTPDFTNYVFQAGESALKICGDRLLHLSGLLAPGDVAARANFQPFEIRELTATELRDAFGAGYKPDRRARAQANVNDLFAQPVASDVNQWRLTCAAGVLMLCGGCLKASKNMFADVEWEDTDEIEWRQELLDYRLLAVLGLAQSLSGNYGDREVKVWDQVICGSVAVAETQ